MSNFLIDEDTDLLAAEFVLGTLDSEERANAQSLLRMDHGFIAMVRIWERRFGELHLMVEPVEPDPSILQRIKAKIAELPPREPAPDGKPPAASPPAPEAAALPAPPEAAMPADAAPAGEPAKPASGAETPKPPDAPENATMPQPAEIAAAGEADKPADAPPAADDGIAAVGEIPSGPESRAPEVALEPEVGPPPQVVISPPPPLSSTPVKSPDQPAAPARGRRPDRRYENAVDVIRSRRRWRAFGLGMTLLAVAPVAMVAAWRFVPDRLPERLRPAELMMSLGIQPPARSGPLSKPAPPESQFDE